MKDGWLEESFNGAVLNMSVTSLTGWLACGLTCCGV